MSQLSFYDNDVYIRKMIDLVIELDIQYETFWNYRNPRDKSSGYCLYYLCNDWFHWGSADGEAIEEADIPDIIQAYQDSPELGGLLWCCRKRKMRPQGAVYRNMLTDDRILFDACGPERSIDIANPYDQNHEYLYKKDEVS